MRRSYGKNTQQSTGSTGKRERTLQAADLAVEGRMGHRLSAEEMKQIDDCIHNRSSARAVLAVTPTGYQYALRVYRKQKRKEPLEVDFRQKGGRWEWNVLWRLARKFLPPGTELYNFVFRWEEAMRSASQRSKPPVVFCRGLDSLTSTEEGILRRAVADGNIRVISLQTKFDSIPGGR